MFSIMNTTKLGIEYLKTIRYDIEHKTRLYFHRLLKLN